MLAIYLVLIISIRDLETGRRVKHFLCQNLYKKWYIAILGAVKGILSPHIEITLLNKQLAKNTQF
jgi:hypothetical protein